MRRAGWVVLLIGGALWLLPSVAGTQYLRRNPSLQKSSAPAVKNLRSLAGCWKGRGPHGGDTRLFYEVVSDGTALIEYLRPVGTSTPQITVYYLDGETLMAHHFCYYGSQIRMKAESTSDPKSLVFKLQDATNLAADRHENHMTYIKMTFPDADHLEADWGQFDRGKEYPSLFSLTRVVEGCKGLDFSTW
jgi:hypothetical protein